MSEEWEMVIGKFPPPWDTLLLRYDSRSCKFYEHWKRFFVRPAAHIQALFNYLTEFVPIVEAPSGLLQLPRLTTFPSSLQTRFASFLVRYTNPSSNQFRDFRRQLTPFCHRLTRSARLLLCPIANEILRPISNDGFVRPERSERLRLCVATFEKRDTEMDGVVDRNESSGTIAADRMVVAISENVDCVSRAVTPEVASQRPRTSLETAEECSELNSTLRRDLEERLSSWIHDQRQSLDATTVSASQTTSQKLTTTVFDLEDRSDVILSVLRSSFPVPELTPTSFGILLEALLDLKSLEVDGESWRGFIKDVVVPQSVAFETGLPRALLHVLCRFLSSDPRPLSIVLADFARDWIAAADLHSTSVAANLRQILDAHLPDEFVSTFFNEVLSAVEETDFGNACFRTVVEASLDRASCFPSEESLRLIATSLSIRLTRDPRDRSSTALLAKLVAAHGKRLQPVATTSLLSAMKANATPLKRGILAALKKLI